MYDICISHKHIHTSVFYADSRCCFLTSMQIGVFWTAWPVSANNLISLKVVFQTCPFADIGATWLSTSKYQWFTSYKYFYPARQCSVRLIRTKTLLCPKMLRCWSQRVARDLQEREGRNLFKIGALVGARALFCSSVRNGSSSSGGDSGHW